MVKVCLKILKCFRPVIQISSWISWRFGRCYQGARVDLTRICNLFAPGMVILSHKNFQFTNLFIPGYWTHAAMIASGDSIIEATFHGVVRRNLVDFISTTDDFVVLKPLFCGPETVANACWYVREKLGCRYNFEFVPHSDAFYCSGLVYSAYLESMHNQQVQNGYPEDFSNYAKGRIAFPNDLINHRDTWAVVLDSNAAIG